MGAALLGVSAARSAGEALVQAAISSGLER